MTIDLPRLLFSTCSEQHLAIDLVQEKRASLLQLNPEWIYQCLSDDEGEFFLRSHYPGDVYQAYKRLNPNYGAARADLIRYCLMYKLGGIYLDIKSTCRVPLRDLIRDDDQYILGQWDNATGSPHEGWGLHEQVRDIEGGEYQQWFIICKPKHPFLEAVIRTVTQNILEFPERSRFTSGRMGVLELTGPIAYSRAIQDYINQYSLIDGEKYRRIQPSNEGLVYSVFEEEDYIQDSFNLAGSTNDDTHRNHDYMLNHYSRRRDLIVLDSGSQDITSAKHSLPEKDN